MTRMFKRIICLIRRHKWEIAAQGDFLLWCSRCKKVTAEPLPGRRI